MFLPFSRYKVACREKQLLEKILFDTYCVLKDVPSPTAQSIEMSMLLYQFNNMLNFTEIKMPQLSGYETHYWRDYDKKYEIRTSYQLDNDTLTIYIVIDPEISPIPGITTYGCSAMHRLFYNSNQGLVAYQLSHKEKVNMRTHYEGPKKDSFITKFKKLFS